MTEHGKDASQRAELKERIIATATEAFTTKGIKSITMDDIAAALGISKRTLYEVFVDKESLLKDCILTVQAERDRYLQEVYEQFDVLLNTDVCNEYSFIEVYESIMFTYIRGISTEKGAKVLEDFISEYRRNRIE